MNEATIRVTSAGYEVPLGTELNVIIDRSGDAQLGAEDSERFEGARWIFEGDYVVVGEPTEPKDPGDLYTLTVPVKNLLELHDLFQVLPRSVVEKISLRTN